MARVFYAESPGVVLPNLSPESVRDNLAMIDEPGGFYIPDSLDEETTSSPRPSPAEPPRLALGRSRAAARRPPPADPTAGAVRVCRSHRLELAGPQRIRRQKASLARR